MSVIWVTVEASLILYIYPLFYCSIMLSLAFLRVTSLLQLLLVGSFLACQDRSTEPDSSPISAVWTTEQLRSSLSSGSNDIVLIEVGAAASYEAGHLAGAYNLDRIDFTNSEDYPYGGMRIGPEQLSGVFSDFGVKPTTNIVLYDDHGNVNAARLYWLLHHYGHPAIALLDGGKVAWEHAGLELTTEIPAARTKTDFQFPTVINSPQLAELDDVLSAMDDDDIVLVDTRESAEYLGAPYLHDGNLYRFKKGAFTNGCIPGAIHLNWTETVDLSGDHRFLPVDVLQERLGSLGITPDKKIITYCQSGVRSAHFTFVLTELLRFPSVFNYDGSWIEWSYHHMNGENVPIERHTDSLSCEQQWQELAATLESETAL